MMCTPLSNPVRVSLLLGLLLSQNVFALNTDRAAPMDLTAEHWQGSMKSGSQVWTGNVRISQGSLKIQADKGTISYQDGDRKSVV